MFPTMFSILLSIPGPKHSTSVPLSVGFVVPLSVDEKEELVVPNPAPVVAEKALCGPQWAELPADACDNVHGLFPPTLQVVNPVMSPVTLHVKAKLPSEHTGGAAVNCPVAAPAWREMDIYMPTFLDLSEMFCVVCVCRLDRYRDGFYCNTALNTCLGKHHCTQTFIACCSPVK